MVYAKAKRPAEVPEEEALQQDSISQTAVRELLSCWQRELRASPGLKTIVTSRLR
jgi:hypothetical protein